MDARLAQAFDRIRRAFLSERRRFRRVAIAANGRFALPDGSEHACEVADISAGGVRVRSEQRPQVGDNVIMYVDALGRVEGPVLRSLDDGFVMRIHAGEAKRERIAEKLTWLVNKGDLAMSEERRHMRAPTETTCSVLLADGRALVAHVIDMSLSGCSLDAAAFPGLGETVIVGRVKGKVVRHHARGFAVEFTEVHPSFGSLSERLKAAGATR